MKHDFNYGLMAMTNEILHTSHKTLITASSVHGVYANALKALAQYGVRHNPKANVITQNLHRVSIHLTPLNSETNPRGFFDKRLYCANRNLTNKVQNAEFAWYMTGTNSVECITPFIKNWSNFSDDGLTVNSNYGYIWKNQIQGVIKKLIADKYTRQGAIQIYDGAMANNMITKDVQCTLNITFEILPNQFGHDALHMTVNMRSNDVVYGLPIDMFCFGTLHELVLHELHLTYPNLLLGVYEHNAVSLHIYEKSFNLLESGVKLNVAKFDRYSNTSIAETTRLNNFWLAHDEYIFSNLEAYIFAEYINGPKEKFNAIISCCELIMSTVTHTKNSCEFNVEDVMILVKNLQDLLGLYLPVFSIAHDDSLLFEHIYQCKKAMQSNIMMLDVFVAYVSLCTSIEEFNRICASTLEYWPGRNMPISSYDVIMLYEKT